MSNQDRVVSEEDIRVMAQAAGISIPDYAMPGVMTNTVLLRHYMALIEELDIPDHCEPAFGYVP